MTQRATSYALPVLTRPVYETVLAEGVRKNLGSKWASEEVALIDESNPILAELIDDCGDNLVKTLGMPVGLVRLCVLTTAVAMHRVLRAQAEVDALNDGGER